jgi:hypothetical protein
MHATFFSLSLFFWMHCPKRVLPCVLLQHCSLFFNMYCSAVRTPQSTSQLGEEGTWAILIIDYDRRPNQTAEFQRISRSPIFLYLLLSQPHQTAEFQRISRSLIFLYLMLSKPNQTVEFLRISLFPHLSLPAAIAAKPNR